MAYDMLVDSAVLDATFTGIADAIRDKTGSTEQISQNDMAEKIPGVYESGHTAGVAEGLVEGYANGQVEGYANGQAEGVKQGRTSFLKDMTGLAYFFNAASGSPQNMDLLDEILQSDLSHITTAQGLFSYNKVITEFDVPDTLNPTNINQIFLNAINLIRVSGLEKMTKVISGSGIFQSCQSLVDAGTIRSTVNIQHTNSFNNCTALEEIRFTGLIGKAISFANSSKLSDASINSIIDALRNLTGSTALRISFHSDVISRMTDEQISAITAKNWTM